MVKGKKRHLLWINWDRTKLTKKLVFRTAKLSQPNLKMHLSFYRFERS